MVSALKFFLGSDSEDGGDDNSDSDSEAEVLSVSLFKINSHGDSAQLNFADNR